jgi:hypothetical protein
MGLQDIVLFFYLMHLNSRCAVLVYGRSELSGSKLEKVPAILTGRTSRKNQ